MHIVLSSGGSAGLPKAFHGTVCFQRRQSEFREKIFIFIIAVSNFAWKLL